MKTWKELESEIKSLDTLKLKKLTTDLKNFRQEVLVSIKETEEELRLLHSHKDQCVREFGIAIKEFTKRQESEEIV